jgi:hypothetical protein
MTMPATKEHISKKLWMLACTPLTVPAAVQHKQQHQFTPAAMPP